MSMKPGDGGATQPAAGQDPVGMVKPALAEPRRPTCRRVRAGYGGYHPVPASRRGVVVSPAEAIRGRVGRVCGLKGAKRAPVADLNVRRGRNARCPTGREPYGYGAPIVVRARESRVHGEGGQGGMSQGPRYA